MQGHRDRYLTSRRSILSALTTCTAIGFSGCSTEGTKDEATTIVAEDDALTTVYGGRQTGHSPTPTTDETSPAEQNRLKRGTYTFEESFTTPKEGQNLDTPTVWHGGSNHALLVTDKTGDQLILFDATNGEHLGYIGRADDVTFDRPNDGVVINDLLFVVERNNARVQVLRMPTGKSIGTFGEEKLRRPYDCTIYEKEGRYEVYVTDDYEATDNSLSELSERVKHFRIAVSEVAVTADHVQSFGATSDPGSLHAVETIHADPFHDHLLISDEKTLQVKLYDLDGDFIRVVTSIFESGHPEGLELLRLGDGQGYWIFTEQTAPSQFHVFDRESFDHLATFTGKTTANTDGVWLTQRAFGPFNAGAFYAIHRSGRYCV